MCKKHPFIEIYDRKLLNLLAPELLALHGKDYSYAGILCTSHEDAKLPFPGMLILYFQDTCEMSERSFNQELAKKTHDYIEAHMDASTLYICCDSGESRSAGIACAMKHIWGEDESVILNNPYFHPNMLVYRLMLEAYGIFLSEKELEQKYDQSRTAFINATTGREFILNRNWCRVTANSRCPDDLKRQVLDFAFYCAGLGTETAMERCLEFAASFDKNAKNLQEIIDKSDELKLWSKAAEWMDPNMDPLSLTSMLSVETHDIDQKDT